MAVKKLNNGFLDFSFDNKGETFTALVKEKEKEKILKPSKIPTPTRGSVLSVSLAERQVRINRMARRMSIDGMMRGLAGAGIAQATGARTLEQPKCTCVGNFHLNCDRHKEVNK